MYAGGTNTNSRGMIGVITSHPIDTWRIRIQIEKKFKYHGLKDMYKGVIPPLLGVTLEKTLVFGSYNFMYNLLEKKNYKSFFKRISNNKIK